MEFDKREFEMKIKGEGEMGLILRYPNFRELMTTLGRLSKKYNGGRVPLSEVILKEFSNPGTRLTPSLN